MSARGTASLSGPRPTVEFKADPVRAVSLRGSVAGREFSPVFPVVTKEQVRMMMQEDPVVEGVVKGVTTAMRQWTLPAFGCIVPLGSLADH